MRNFEKKKGLWRLDYFQKALGGELVFDLKIDLS